MKNHPYYNWRLKRLLSAGRKSFQSIKIYKLQQKTCEQFCVLPLKFHLLGTVLKRTDDETELNKIFKKVSKEKI